MPDTSEKIRAIIAQQLEIKDEKVMENSSIVEDLGADSLDVIGVFSVLEEKFDIQIPDEDSDKIITVRDLVSYINERIA